MFEHVAQVTDYYDGIREGIAHFRGAPHHFRHTGWLAGDPDEDQFELRPLGEDHAAPIIAHGEFRRSASAREQKGPPFPLEVRWTLIE